MNYSLIIVDMQYGFMAARQNALRKPILREIALAKKHNRQIIVVHFARFGRTFDYILKALRGYKNKFFVRKNYADGSDKVIKVLKNNNVRICGIEASACVFDTAYWLRRTYLINSLPINIYMVKDACGDCVKKSARQAKGNDHTLDTFSNAINDGLSVLYPNRQHPVVLF